MIRVVHLLPMLLQKDGPSNGIFNLVKAPQSQVEWAGVWSSRRAPVERDRRNSWQHWELRGQHSICAAIFSIPW